MELNADFTRRVVLHAARLSWVASPTPGIDRRMLDRVGDEVARATSIVRYAPGSAYPAHTHGGGEEFLVLDGIFQDGEGDYPAGAYVRNPPGSGHAPASATGCTIFVKLRQFDPADRLRVRLDTQNRAFSPAAHGVETMPLASRPGEDVRIERWAPGAHVTASVPGGLELLVLDGSLAEGGDALDRLSWLRLPPGATFDAVAGGQGCRLWVKTGHLAQLSGKCAGS